jgi:hypothetical protein
MKNINKNSNDVPKMETDKPTKMKFADHKQKKKQ